MIVFTVETAVNSKLKLRFIKERRNKQKSKRMYEKQMCVMPHIQFYQTLYCDGRQNREQDKSLIEVNAN